MRNIDLAQKAAAPICFMLLINKLFTVLWMGGEAFITEDGGIDMFKTKRFFAAALIASAALAPLTADAWWGFPFGGGPWNNGWGGGPWGGGPWGGGPWGGGPWGGYPGYGYGYPAYGYGYPAYGYQPYGYPYSAPAATTTEKK